MAVDRMWGNHVWLTVREAAEYLNISERELYRKIAAGKGPLRSTCIPGSRLRRIHVDWLRAFMGEYDEPHRVRLQEISANG